MIQGVKNKTLHGNANSTMHKKYFSSIFSLSLPLFLSPVNANSDTIIIGNDLKKLNPLQ